jgi:error-prone DNA polymerase
MSVVPAFAEAVAATNFSFLRGASHPQDMVLRAWGLGMTGLGIADRNSVAGVVRAYRAWQDVTRSDGRPFRLVAGARLVFADGTPDLVAHPMTRHGWGRLTRLLTEGNRRAAKGECELRLPDLLDHAEDIALIAMDADEALLEALRAATPCLWLAASMPRGGRDSRQLVKRMALSARTGVPLIATNDVLYHAPGDRPIQDVLTCIREGCRSPSGGPTPSGQCRAPSEDARRNGPAVSPPCPRRWTTGAAMLARHPVHAGPTRSIDYPREPVPDGWDAQGWMERSDLMQGARDIAFRMACRMPRCARRWRRN